MTPEEQAAADAAAAAAKAAAEAGDDVEKTPGYWKAEAKKTAEKLAALKEKAKAGDAAAAELQALKDKDLSESQRLAKENEGLKGKAARAEALEAEVQALLDEATAGLTDAQKAVIVGDTPEARLKHLRALQAAGMLGEPNPGRSPGGEMPGRGGGGAVKQSAVAAMTNTQRAALYKDVAEGKRTVVPG